MMDLEAVEDVCDDPDEPEGLSSADGLVEAVLFPDDVSELVSGQFQCVATGGPVYGVLLYSLEYGGGVEEAGHLVSRSVLRVDTTSAMSILARASLRVWISVLISSSSLFFISCSRVFLRSLEGLMPYFFSFCFISAGTFTETVSYFAMVANCIHFRWVKKVYLFGVIIIAR